MPLESFRHSSYFGKCYALTIIYNLTIPRRLEWKNFWKTKTWYNWYFKYYSLFIFHGSRLFSKSGIKRIVEIFTWYQKILRWLNSVFSQTEHVVSKTENNWEIFNGLKPLLCGKKEGKMLPVLEVTELY